LHADPQYCASERPGTKARPQSPHTARLSRRRLARRSLCRQASEQTNIPTRGAIDWPQAKHETMEHPVQALLLFDQGETPSLPLRNARQSGLLPLRDTRQAQASAARLCMAFGLFRSPEPVVTH
jgi:hypothetical protein